MPRVLALNSFHAGSHRAFLDGWITHSRHSFALQTLPGRHWKWRMRHAAITFARQLRVENASGFDVIFCTDMLNLAEFRGLVGNPISDLPAILYFHENQLTYPSRQHDSRDEHFAFTNLISAFAADAVWFNSSYHRDTFLEAAEDWIGRFPDFAPRDELAALPDRCEVMPPGIEVPGEAPSKSTGPLHVGWVARWEHDKNPELFFAALRAFRDAGGEFRLTVLGEEYAQAPDCFAQAREEFAHQIVHWGFEPGDAGYRSRLAALDVVLSTATHEFFGIAVAEAVAAGAFPLVPGNLAYPELYGDIDGALHAGTVAAITARLHHLAARKQEGTLSQSAFRQAFADRFHWPTRAAAMDERLQAFFRQ